MTTTLEKPLPELLLSELRSLGATEARLQEILQRRASTNRIKSLYPDTGPLRRELYPKHLQFFKAGATEMERAAIAANRVGKTRGIGAYEVTCHLTGDYPEWWEGRRFEHPIECWAAGDTSETTRDIVQDALFGPVSAIGTGMIPQASIVGDPTRRMGVANAFDTAQIRHKSGGTSLIGLKSYDQGRKKFQGTAKHVIWLDEEPPEDVYDECLIRLMTTNGLMIGTFTPLSGLSNVVLRYMPHLAPGDK